MKKKAVFPTAFISALLLLLVSGTIFVDSAKANWVIPRTFLPEIVINSDGTITPETSLINRTRNGYTLTANVDGYAIIIKRSNIVFDGAGYTLNTTNGDNEALRLLGVDGVTVENLEIFSGYTSIELFSCLNCLLTNVKTNYSISKAAGSSSNTITNSTVQILSIGDRANNNLVIKNNIFRELRVAGSNNLFSQNNFFLDGLPIIFRVAGDVFWDKGSVGNYWSDYNGTDANGDGVGDTPYVIDADNQDDYPRMYPWSFPCVSLLSLENSTYVGGFPLNFTVNKPVLWMGYSLDGQDNIAVTGNVTLTSLSVGWHNITVYAKDEVGNIGASDTIIFNIAEEPPEPFPVVPVAAVSVASAGIIAAGLLVYFKKRKEGKGS